MIPLSPPLTPAEIRAVYAAGPAAIVRLVGDLQAQLAAQQQELAALRAQQQALTAQAATQQDTIAALTAQVATLQQRLGRHSGNSHQPPSADGPARPPRPPRRRRGRRPGGQPGHGGHALRFSPHPDRVVVHRPARCRACGADLAAAPATFLERHQVVDLPPLALETVAHQTVACACPACGAATVGTFPPEAAAQLSYGPRLLALGVYLTDYQLLPYARASEALTDLFGAGPTPGTLVAAQQRAAAQLGAAEQVVRERLRAAAVAHFDETGINIGGAAGLAACGEHGGVHALRAAPPAGDGGHGSAGGVARLRGDGSA